MTNPYEPLDSTAHDARFRRPVRILFLGAVLIAMLGVIIGTPGGFFLNQELT